MKQKGKSFLICKLNRAQTAVILDALSQYIARESRGSLIASDLHDSIFATVDEKISYAEVKRYGKKEEKN
jgi:hypothetical protein